jgi:hypothetical protein
MEIDFICLDCDSSLAIAADRGDTAIPLIDVQEGWYAPAKWGQ